MPDVDGIIRCSWCETTLYGDDPDFLYCHITGEAHQECHDEGCYPCAEADARDEATERRDAWKYGYIG